MQMHTCGTFVFFFVGDSGSGCGGWEGSMGAGDAAGVRIQVWWQRYVDAKGVENMKTDDKFNANAPDEDVDVDVGVNTAEGNVNLKAQAALLHHPLLHIRLRLWLRLHCCGRLFPFPFMCNHTSGLTFHSLLQPMLPGPIFNDRLVIASKSIMMLMPS